MTLLCRCSCITLYPYRSLVMLLIPTTFSNLMAWGCWLKKKQNKRIHRQKQEYNSRNWFLAVYIQFIAHSKCFYFHIYFLSFFLSFFQFFSFFLLIVNFLSLSLFFLSSFLFNVLSILSLYSCSNTFSYAFSLSLSLLYNFFLS